MVKFASRNFIEVEKKKISDRIALFKAQIRLRLRISPKHALDTYRDDLPSVRNLDVSGVCEFIAIPSISV